MLIHAFSLHSSSPLSRKRLYRSVVNKLTLSFSVVHCKYFAAQVLSVWMRRHGLALARMACAEGK